MRLPTLYSFRRCPYAMRARLALVYAQQSVELREIVLKNKPASLLALSPKGTVPVLQLPEGEHWNGLPILEESRDIMCWALAQHDPEAILQQSFEESQQLLDQNDQQFKYWLDRYKYADRYPEQHQDDYRTQGADFLQQLEQRLSSQPYLLGSKVSLADLGLMPFVRQFAHVDRHWFYAAPYPHVQRWLDHWLNTDAFKRVMTAYKPWQEGEIAPIF